MIDPISAARLPEKRLQWRVLWGDCLGAFADGGVLFPLVSLLVLQTDYRAVTLFLGAGLAYIASGLYYRIPMSVQPLKSAVVLGIVLHASANEIAVSGLLVGFSALLLSFLPLKWLQNRFPPYLIYGVQLSLGLMLMQSALKYLPQHWLLALLLLSLIWGVKWLFNRSILGYFALLFLVYGLFFAARRPHDSLYFPLQSLFSHHFTALHALRIPLILQLWLPQLALTMTNSVVATRTTALKYFKGSEARVTLRSLLTTIGLGNLAAFLIGGLPFCHGSGGLSAHALGGARSYRNNLFIGGTLLLLALPYVWGGGGLLPTYQSAFLFVLLFSVGIQHALLARDSILKNPYQSFILLVMAALSLWTHNMLWVVAVGLCLHFLGFGLKMVALKIKP